MATSHVVLAAACSEVTCSSAVRSGRSLPLAERKSKLRASFLWRITGFAQMTCDLAKSPTSGGG
ncbi:hypothetical protein PF003_g6517 [Phytophthora fragariae]|nr:hypothetical protein PF003_g6517 [Phytophthora fragariae]